MSAPDSSSKIGFLLFAPHSFSEIGFLLFLGSIQPPPLPGCLNKIEIEKLLYGRVRYRFFFFWF